jgi:2-keto-myo-inositol isomerase
MTADVTRRQWLAGAAALAAATPALGAETKKTDKPFRFMLNTSTIRERARTLTEQIEIAAKAGYDAIEPWMQHLDAHVKSGKSLEDAGKLIKDKGLRCESAIGFAPWLVEDAAERKKGLEQARRDMDLVAKLGGKRIAAPPANMTNAKSLDLFKAAERYAALCKVGEDAGIVPMVEVWGFSKTLSRLGECALVAIESGHKNACVLADVYHLHKGGSGFTGVKQLSAVAMQVFHVNDYPADPPREKIMDKDRVYPGDGVAPLTTMLRDLHALGFRGLLSLELFNPTYWKEDPLTVAKTGLAKMKAVVKKAMEEKD